MRVEYDAALRVIGKVRTVQSPGRLFTETIRYVEDMRGRLARADTIDAQGRLKTQLVVSYDQFGLPVEARDELGTTRYDYGCFAGMPTAPIPPRATSVAAAPPPPTSPVNANLPDTTPEVESHLRYCSQNDGISCYNAAKAFEEGRQIKRNPQRAFELSKRGCELDVALSCEQLGYHYKDGDGTTRSVRLAAEAYGKACAIRPNKYACGEMKFLGGTLPPRPSAAPARAFDVDKAKRVGDQAFALLGCEEGNFADCQKSCDARNPKGCQRLGEMYNKGGGGAPKDLHKAMGAFLRACDFGLTLGCHNYAVLVMQTGGEKTVGATFFEQACESDHAESCFSWAMCLKEGIGVPRDPSKGDQVLQKACKLGSRNACQRLPR
jgi:TPR repeat protein